MNCRDLEADIVDLARGAGLSAATAERVRQHLGECARCANRFAGEQELTAELKAVAHEAPAMLRAPVIEEQLLRAFAERRAAAAQPAPIAAPMFDRPAVRAWLAAAAVLILAVAVWQGTARWRPVEPAQPAPVAATAQPGSAQAAARPASPAEAQAQAAAPAALPAQSRPESGGNTEPGGNAALSVPARAARNPVPPAAAAGEDEAPRFVALPTAIGLPGLESGRIVRVEVQAAMLPAYGVDIAPDSAGGVVQADVLVGQDGQPRAIRFVNLDSTPRRRQ